MHRTAVVTWLLKYVDPVSRFVLISCSILKLVSWRGKGCLVDVHSFHHFDLCDMLENLEVRIPNSWRA